METKYHPNGAVKSIKYRAGDLLHRIDGPALQQWDSDGILIKSAWYHEGYRHRSDGPALQDWTDNSLCEEWYQNGLRHRNDGPAVKWSREGMMLDEVWYQNGRPHRDNGPAHQQWNSQMCQTVLTKELWFYDGHPHRDDGPAVQHWRGGKLINQQWWHHGLQHREDGPAIINVTAFVEHQWRRRGKLHRYGGPAVQSWKNGVLIYEAWWVKSRFHRHDGPAVQRWNDDGDALKSKWYLDGRKLSPREICALLLPDAVMFTLSEILPQPIYEEIAAAYR